MYGPTRTLLYMQFAATRGAIVPTAQLRFAVLLFCAILLLFLPIITPKSVYKRQNNMTKRRNYYISPFLRVDLLVMQILSPFLHVCMQYCVRKQRNTW